MEGYLQYYQGRFAGYKKVFAIIEEGCVELALFKFQAYEDQIIRFGLKASSNGQPLTFIKGAMNYGNKSKDKDDKGLQRVVIEVSSTSLEFQLLLYFKRGSSSKYIVEKLKFRTDTIQEKEHWVLAINKLTDNLASETTYIDDSEIITLRSTDIFDANSSDKTNPKKYNPNSLKKLYEQNYQKPSLNQVQTELIEDNSDINAKIQELNSIYEQLSTLKGDIESIYKSLEGADKQTFEINKHGLLGNIAKAMVNQEKFIEGADKAMASLQMQKTYMIQNVKQYEEEEEIRQSMILREGSIYSKAQSEENDIVTDLKTVPLRNESLYQQINSRQRSSSKSS